ncbi:glycosyltransferase family 4 protein [Labrenzia sp. 011]|uniref:glycosyltransferase family 4 protein n=1 Tax=Labrenzia sp. 011 TaxID=2171494 RepID=UPI000D51C007|nr:glycosyltransferase family 4 protein [Labrenzia sp. 011]PVB62773.1 glycosyl transferase family 1 [Labrenzia sp. 011]
MSNQSLPPSVNHVALIGNFPPRQCGIATFTADLHAALKSAKPSAHLSVVAMTDPGQSYAYPGDVGYEIAQNDPDAYVAAAGHIDALNPDVVSIQHEFGIYGGASGELLLKLVERLRAPIVTTLHTVLTDPTPAERRVMNALARHSSRLVVMTDMARAILTDTWKIPTDKIAVIPHGIPDLPFLDPAFQKHHFGLDGSKVALTFGLLSPNKGIENMIAALPALVKAHPDLVYVVLGATHPHLIAREGEAYRQSLQDKARALGVTDHVRFINEYVDTLTLQAWLSAADIYVTPYLNEAQITSGTLSYAVGLGKAVVSTPYWHAQELLANDTGALVPFADPAALAETIAALLDNHARRDRLRSRAYDAGRAMIWPVVAKSYFDLFAQARADASPSGTVHAFPQGKLAPPSSTLAAVDRMTDGCGMLQHSRSSIADRRHGYCLDDNARALMLAVGLKSEDIEAECAARIIDTCAAFVEYAWDEKRSVFRNFMDYQRSWLEKEGSQDSHGRALWSLGRVAADTDDHGVRVWATTLADQVIPASERLDAPRAMAFSVLGLTSYLTVYPGHRPAQRLLQSFANRLHDMLIRERRGGWDWFEPDLSYDNARLPEALIRAGSQLSRTEMVSDGLAALTWLADVQTSENHEFRPVGTESFGIAYKRPRPFDQQPLEAWAMIDACSAAYAVSPDPAWPLRAEAAFNWYLGRNDLGLRLATATQGCYDGLQVDRVNLNQGAESILSFQLAALSLRQLQAAVRAQAEQTGMTRAG